jgi:hypothetical protein
MTLQTGKYYHLYNAVENREIIFKEEQEYLFFLERYRIFIGEFVTTLAYCLTPSEFHFVIKVIAADCDALKKNIDAFFSSYEKAINNGYTKQEGAVFLQPELKEINPESYLLPLVTYVHQNPVRLKLVERIEDWKYSSYQHFAEMRNDAIANKEFIRLFFSSPEAFRRYSEGMIYEVRRKMWM